MHFNHAINNPIMLDSENLNINEWEKILVNIFIILLFVFVNPFHALIICGFLNLMSSRINYWTFSCMFASSFALMYLLQDYSVANLPNNSETRNHVQTKILQKLKLPPKNSDTIDRLLMTDQKSQNQSRS